MAKLYSIGGRLKAHELNYSTSSDFELTALGDVRSETVFDEPGWSPYCIDHATGELIMVRLPPDVDLSRSSFYFIAQYRQAERVLKLPLGEIEQLTTALPDPTVVIIYSMGRSGTTLASLALNESPHAWSLGEPEVFNHKSLILPPGALISGGNLVRAMIRLVFAGRSKREATTIVLKLRSQSLFHMQQFIDGRPDARAVFMYRDAMGWAQSVFQFLNEFGWEMLVADENRQKRWDFFSGAGPVSDLGRFVDLGEPSTSLPAMIGAGWAYHLEAYLRRLDQGVQALAIRYNELNRSRHAEIAKLFHHAGLGDDGLDTAVTVFDEDSQKGTGIGQREGKVRLTDDQLGEVRAVLARTTRFADPNLILPDIYSR